MEKIEAAITSKNQKLLGELAHQLKGSCHSIGAMELGSLGHEIEVTAKAVKKIDWAKMTETFKDVRTSYEKLDRLARIS